MTIVNLSSLLIQLKVSAETVFLPASTISVSWKQTNNIIMQSLTVVFLPKRVWRSRLKANLCCWVIPVCRVEYCCSRAQEEFRDSKEAREGTRPAWL